MWQCTHLLQYCGLVNFFKFFGGLFLKVMVKFPRLGQNLFAIRETTRINYKFLGFLWIIWNENYEMPFGWKIFMDNWCEIWFLIIFWVNCKETMTTWPSTMKAILCLLFFFIFGWNLYLPRRTTNYVKIREYWCITFFFFIFENQRSVFYSKKKIRVC